MHRRTEQERQEWLIWLSQERILAKGLERDLISLRTKEALPAKKQQGKTLGKPKGTLQKSKFDADLEQIKDFLKLGLSARKIATLLGYTNHLALNTYITKRQLREPSSETG